MVALGERAGEEGDGEQHGRVQEDREHFEEGRLARLRQPEEGQEVAAQHDVEVEEAPEAGRHQAAAEAEQEAALYHREHVEEGEDRVRPAARRDDARHEGYVEADLHPREAAKIGPVRAHDQEDA